MTVSDLFKRILHLCSLNVSVIVLTTLYLVFSNMRMGPHQHFSPVPG